MNNKKMITTTFLVLLTVSTASAVQILNIEATPLTIGEQVDINATVDGEGTTVDSVRVSVYENRTAITENNLMTFESGDTKQISYWIENNLFELKDNSVYEINVVASEKTKTDELLLYINTTNNLTTEFEEPEELNQDIVSKLLRDFGLNEGFFSKGLGDLTMGEIVVVVLIIILGLRFWD